MKSLFIAILLISPSAMANSETNILSSMPLSKMFWGLYLERTIIGQYDCSNKCGKYARALSKAGHQADLVIIRPHRSRYLHAIVRLSTKDKIVYLDHTKGVISDDLESLGHLKEVISIQQLKEKGAKYR